MPPAARRGSPGSGSRPGPAGRRARAGAARRPHELPDRRRPQRCDPVHPPRPEFFVDAGIGNHAPVPHHRHPLQAEALLEPVQCRPHGLGVAGVAPEDFHRHRQPLRRGQKPEEHLPLAPASPLGPPKGRQRTRTALKRHRRRVPQHPLSLRQVTGGQLPLDPTLPPIKPVQGFIEIVGIGPPDTQHLSQRAR